MHLLQRLYRGVVLPIEIDRRAMTGVVPALRTRPGFMGFITVDFGAEVFATFTAYADKADSEAVLAAVPGVIQRSLSDLIPRPAEVSGGDVLLRHRADGRAEVLVVRRYSACADAAELAQRVGTQLLPRFTALPGFKGYMLVDAGQGEVLSLNLFGTAGDADVLNTLAAPLVRQHLADLLPMPPQTLVGQVLSDIRA